VASALVVANEAVEAFEVGAFTELLTVFGANIVVSNFTPRLAIH
jgi:hypothetical protein